uniref:Phosphohistidine phosphatase n=1 Tax=Candidatus Kentrum sp. UNK TaxID=2126344 RepID=A0A451AV64_9GAMM|nr:MAG: phosphohistidine phosphatase [Candidatus Kentron sp. UNK]VFK69950.1 MAG: phosphohistidine phosphatase [Candidatus Kentron sp. UNK]
MYSVKELLLLRHAKSDWNAAASDFERPLSKRGMRDAPRVGRWLHGQGLGPDFVISSPALRARQTALAVCEAFGIGEDRIHWEARIYDAALQTLWYLLTECDQQAERVLLVGHNPGLALLLAQLCPTLESPSDGKILPTATLARIRMPVDWRTLAPGSGVLLSVTRPSAMDADPK